MAVARSRGFTLIGVLMVTLATMPTYQPSASVTITVHEASRGGWSATAVSGGVVRRCYLFVGSAAPVGAATQEGQVACS